MARLTFWEWQPDTGQMTWSSDSLPLKDGSDRPPSSPAALMARMQPPDAERFAAALARAQGSGEPFDLEFELDGDQHVVRMRGAQASASDGIPLVNGALQDVTSLRRSEALADYLARHDELTELDNRRGFTEQLDAALARLRESAGMSGNRRPPERVVLVGLLDITMFQRLNDALGESVANRVLTYTGLRIRAFPHLLSRLSSIIEAAGVATQRIEFELTESLAMQRPDQAAEVLSAFRDQAGSIVHQPKAWRPKNRQRR